MNTNSDGSALQCELCASRDVPVVYQPSGSLRAASVHCCGHCGLLFSTYGLSSTKHAPSTSSDANWGNIRHGKGLRVDAQWPTLESLLNKLKRNARVLDVGANRGDFLIRAAGVRDDLQMTGVEPDGSIVQDWADSIDVDLKIERLENTLLDGPFDFVFCSHTLEHASSARGMLDTLRALVASTGVLFLEVPDVRAIEDGYYLEEFFIDKHSFHFSFYTLDALLQETGWQIVDKPSDGSANLTRVCLPTEPVQQPNSGTDVQKTLAGLDGYAHRLQSAPATLSRAAEWIQDLAQRQTVAIWGAGRMLDALVRKGGLSLNDVVLVDSYLSKYLASVHGKELLTPSTLADRDIQVCILMTRGSSGKVAVEAKAYGIRHTVTFDEIMQIAT